MDTMLSILASQAYEQAHYFLREDPPKRCGIPEKHEGVTSKSIQTEFLLSPFPPISPRECHGPESFDIPSRSSDKASADENWEFVALLEDLSVKGGEPNSESKSPQLSLA
ncbi:hypothetical protein ACHAXS_011040 [Conticribra weissflogii]